LKKHTISLYLLFAAILLAGSFFAQSVSHAQRDSLQFRRSFREEARVGKKAPDFKLKDQFGKKHKLKDYRGKIVVLEWLNPACPFVQRHYKAGTTVNLEKEFVSAENSDVVWLRINSTAKKAEGYLNAKEMKAWGEEHGVTGPILDDSKGRVGHLYGAKSTPALFVIDKSGKLVFSGAIDNDPYGRRKPENRHIYVADILAAYRDGKPVKPSANKSYGCSIKYKN